MNKISFQGSISINDLPNRKKQLIQLDSNNDQFVRDILPLRIQNFEIRKLEWRDFIGKPDQDSPWIAHCYWSNQYEYYVQNDREHTTIQASSPLRLPRMPLQQINNPLNQMNIQNQQRGRLSSANKLKRPPTPNTNNSPSKIITRSNSQSALRKQSPFKQKIKLSVKCKFQEKSWAKQKTNDLLLEHETCHYLIGCLSALEFKRKIESLDLLTNQNFREEIKNIFKINLKEFVKIEKDYDEETNHFRNQEKQKAWNRKIKEQLLMYEMYFNN